MPELGSYGSVRGAAGNSRPYRERRQRRAAPQAQLAGVLDSLYLIACRIRSADNKAALSGIKHETDAMLETQLAKAAAGDEDALDAATLNLAAHRLKNLIHYRRAALAFGYEQPDTGFVWRVGVPWGSALLLR